MSQIKWRWSFNVKFCWILWSILWTWCCMCTQENADYKTCGCCDCLNVWSISFKGHLLKKTCFWNTLKLIYFLHIISLYIIFNRGLSIHFTFNVTWRKLIKTFFFFFSDHKAIDCNKFSCLSMPNIKPPTVYYCCGFCHGSF